MAQGFAVDGERFQQWLRNSGVEGERRVVRASDTSILVSKFPPGFAQELLARLESLPELFDTAAAGDAFRTEARAEPGTTRVELWHRAILGMLRRLAQEHGLDARQVAEVEAGVDSVAALLDAVLWSSPVGGDGRPASAAEADAFAEALSRMDAESSLFTKHYGVFEGTRVENHCPGSRFARVLFQQGWEICSADDG